jgi:hypothetical protein
MDLLPSRIPLALIAILSLCARESRAAGTVDLYGFVSRDGHVIGPAWRAAGEFSDGLAYVSTVRNGPWGYINTNGKLVIKEQFKSVQSFHNGFAFVQVEDGSWVRIDKSGDVVNELKDITSPSEPGPEGPFPCEVGTLHGYMNEKGEIAIPATFEQAGPFSEGLAAVKLGGKIGFIDATGKMVIAPQFFHRKRLWEVSFRHAPQFHGGLAPVSLIEADDALIGYIDKTGKVALKPAWSDAGYFIDGLSPVQLPGQKSYFFIDRTGAALSKETYAEAWDFREGTSMVTYADKHTAVIDPQGSVVLTIPGAPFTEGPYERVIKFKDPANKASGFMDLNGHIVIPATYLSLWDMQGGMAKFVTQAEAPGPSGFAGIHYVWYRAAQQIVLRASGGRSYYLNYAHVYAPKGTPLEKIAAAVTAQGDLPSASVPLGSGVFEYNLAQMTKSDSTVSDEALKRAGVLVGEYGSHHAGKASEDSVWSTNLGVFQAR